LNLDYLVADPADPADQRIAGIGCANTRWTCAAGTGSQ
jgi:hypothetical protein